MQRSHSAKQQSKRQRIAIAFIFYDTALQAQLKTAVTEPR